MLFPIIRVKDGDYMHIIGTNSHDTLFVDEDTGGIHYLNLKCCESTKKFNGESTFKFVPKELEVGEIYPRIEFVTLEELIRIATENMIKQTDNKVAFHKMIEESMDKFIESKSECEEKLKTNNLKDSSGRLIF